METRVTPDFPAYVKKGNSCQGINYFPVCPYSGSLSNSSVSHLGLTYVYYIAFIVIKFPVELFCLDLLSPNLNVSVSAKKGEYAHGNVP